MSEKSVRSKRSGKIDLSKLNVLIVDDQNFVLAVLRQSLLYAGVANVKVANHPRLALKILQTEKVDLAIIDFKMPEINGLELLRLIRSNKIDVVRKLPVIMQTAFSDTAVFRIALQLDVSGFIAKPASNEVIMQRLYLTLSQNKKIQEAKYYSKFVIPKLAENSISSNKGENDKYDNFEVIKLNGRHVSISELKPGNVLKGDIVDNRGQLLLAKNTKISPSLIEKLNQINDIARLEDIHIK